ISSADPQPRHLRRRPRRYQVRRADISIRDGLNNRDFTVLRAEDSRRCDPRPNQAAAGLKQATDQPQNAEALPILDRRRKCADLSAQVLNVVDELARTALAHLTRRSCTSSRLRRSFAEKPRPLIFAMSSSS